ncbi:RraA family protein [Arthrobacter sp. GMC3]|uniref:RraA family protein n=1 Tax=Arthrobacter sp. GMC3 TaxID=2058894 RepID=UPI000CE4D7AF|nr:RraA family protein [Arthrobacter sp. GMC3]
MQDVYDYGTDVRELVERYRALYSGAIYDVLDGMGYPNQALAPDIKPIRQDMVIAGPAFTVKGIPDVTASTDMRDRRIHLFNDMRATGVPLLDVRDCSFDTQVAHYGEMNATVGAASGVVGAIIDGGCRDTGFLLKRDFPVMARYLSPVEAYQRWSYYEWQKPIVLRGALTTVVPVNPGDFLMGDLDGAVVIPRALVVEVLLKCEELIRTEDNARSDFASGMDPVEVYKKYGRL